MVVKSAYAAQHEDELTLVKGARLLIIEKCSNGWWRGSSGGRSGWFPSIHVLGEGDSEATSVEPEGSNHQSAGSGVLLTVQALWTFTSAAPEELSSDEGEVMEVIVNFDTYQEWFLCCNEGDLAGFVPKNHVVVLSDGLSGSSPRLLPLQAPPPPPRFLSLRQRPPRLRPLPLDSSPISSSLSLTHKLTGNDWYFGKITRHQANCVLRERGVEADFLVRSSE